MILKLDTKDQGEGLYNIYINDPMITLTYFTAMSLQVAHAFEWGKLSKYHMNRKLGRKWAIGLKSYDHLKKKWTLPGVIYMNITIIFKDLLL